MNSHFEKVLSLLRESVESWSLTQKLVCMFRAYNMCFQFQTEIRTKMQNFDLFKISPRIFRWIGCGFPVFQRSGPLWWLSTRTCSGFVVQVSARCYDFFDRAPKGDCPSYQAQKRKSPWRIAILGIAHKGDCPSFGVWRVSKKSPYIEHIPVRSGFTDTNCAMVILLYFTSAKLYDLCYCLVTDWYR